MDQENLLANLRERMRPLNALLADPQPGHAVWWVLLGEDMQALIREWSGQPSHWTKELPTEPGWYWFSGSPYRRHLDAHVLRPLEVKQSGARLVYFLNGKYWCPTEMGPGQFCKMAVPEEPAQ